MQDQLIAPTIQPRTEEYGESATSLTPPRLPYQELELHFQYSLVEDTIIFKYLFSLNITLIDCVLIICTVAWSYTAFESTADRNNYSRRLELLFPAPQGKDRVNRNPRQNVSSNPRVHVLHGN